MTEAQVRSLYELLLAAAEEIALDSYGCDLDRLDPSELEWYEARVTEENFDAMASDLAADAWQAY